MRKLDLSYDLLIKTQVPYTDMMFCWFLQSAVLWHDHGVSNTAIVKNPGTTAQLYMYIFFFFKYMYIWLITMFWADIQISETNSVKWICKTATFCQRGIIKFILYIFKVNISLNICKFMQGMNMTLYPGVSHKQIIHWRKYHTYYWICHQEALPC